MKTVEVLPPNHSAFIPPRQTAVSMPCQFTGPDEGGESDIASRALNEMLKAQIIDLLGNPDSDLHTITKAFLTLVIKKSPHTMMAFPTVSGCFSPVSPLFPALLRLFPLFQEKPWALLTTAARPPAGACQ